MIGKPLLSFLTGPYFERHLLFSPAEVIRSFPVYVPIPL